MFRFVPVCSSWGRYPKPPVEDARQFLGDEIEPRALEGLAFRPIGVAATDSSVVSRLSPSVLSDRHDAFILDSMLHQRRSKRVQGYPLRGGKPRGAGGTLRNMFRFHQHGRIERVAVDIRPRQGHLLQFEGGDGFQFVAISQLRVAYLCLLYTSPSPRDGLLSRMPSSA